MTLHWADNADVPLYFFDDEWGVDRDSTDIDERHWDALLAIKSYNYSSSALASTLFFDCRGERIALVRRLQRVCVCARATRL